MVAGKGLSWAALETCGHQEAVGSTEAPKCTEMVSLQVPDGDVLVGNAGLFPFLLIIGSADYWSESEPNTFIS